MAAAFHAAKEVEVGITRLDETVGRQGELARVNRFREARDRKACRALAAFEHGLGQGWLGDGVVSQGLAAGGSTATLVRRVERLVRHERPVDAWAKPARQRSLSLLALLVAVFRRVEIRD